MTVYTKLTVAGVEYLDSSDISLRKTIGETSSTSRLEIQFGNENGRHATDFTEGAEVILYADNDISPATTKRFAGILTEKKFEGKGGNRERLTLMARDYTALLQKNTVEPEVYTNQEISAIAIDLIQKYAPSDFTTTNISTTGVTLTRIVFKQVSVFDALKQLADLAGNHFFYVDEDKNVFFKQKSTVSSGFTLDNTNVLSSSFRTDVDSVKNRCYVYGGRQLVAARTATFTSDGAGSVFTLDYSPHNTTLLSPSGTAGIRQKGDIFMGTQSATSGADYLVNYHDKQIIFQSGTTIGYSSIPASGTSFTVDGFRSVPIVKLAEDPSSVIAYGKRTEIVVDDGILDPTTATKIAKTRVDQNKDPAVQGTLELQGVVTLTPGNTVVVNMPNHNVNSMTYDILEANYDFTTDNNQKEKVLTVKVSKKISDITDILKDIILAQRRAQAAQIDENSVLTRLLTGAGSFAMKTPSWEIRTRAINDTFILGHPINGVLGLVNPKSVGSILSGTSVTWTSGVGIGYNKALNIGSPSYVELGSADTLLQSGALTISAWITQNTPNGGGFYPIISNSNQGMYEVSVRAGSLHYRHSGTSIDLSGNFVESGTWYHVAIARDFTNSYIYGYINGSLIGSSSYSTIPRFNNTGINIGKRAGAGFWREGNVDEVRIYNRFLSTAEIGSLYQKQNYPRDKLVAYYKFDEGVGSFAYNSASVEMPTGDAILHYRFNNSGASIVDEVNGKIGSESIANSTLWVAGVYGNGSAIAPSGTSSAGGFNLFNDTAALQFTSGDNFTVATWHRVVSGNFVASSTAGVVMKGTTTTCNYGIHLISGPNTTAQYEFGFRSGNFSVTTRSAVLQRNQWNHIAGVYSGANYTMQVFYNGSPGSVINTGGSPFNGGLGSLVIGRLNSVINNNAASGILTEFGEVRIYNRAISPSEVQDLYWGKTVQPLLGDRRGAASVVVSGGE